MGATLSTKCKSRLIAKDRVVFKGFTSNHPLFFKVGDQNSARITQEFFVLQQQKYTKQGCLNGSDTSPSFVFEHAVARITPINYWMMVEHGPQFHLHTLS